MKNNLDIVIVSHNVKNLLADCLNSIIKNQTKNDDWHIIVVDNASTDGTQNFIKEKFKNLKFIESKENLGFAGGNNLARKKVKSDYVLFLNPDTKIIGGVIQKTLNILREKNNIGAIGCRVNLPDGHLDYSCHRGLPTIWNTFSYWSGLSRIFPKYRFFSGYTATHLSYSQSHEIDCISGTYLLAKKKVLNEIGWWDEDYFWNGEDIEMCYQIKKRGWKIWYEAREKIIHYKGSSSGLWESAAVAVPKETSLKAAKSAAKVMNIFVKKHWEELGPAPLIGLVWLGIRILEKYRIAKLKLGFKYA